MNCLSDFVGINLVEGVRSRIVHDVNGLDIHILEAGFEQHNRPRLLLLHGFPELAYSWRHVISPLANAGYHVIAPDQRGYGRTIGWSSDFASDLRAFGLTNLVRDAVALLARLGFSSVDAVIGHDFGSPVAAHCALIRPDIFHSVVMMSAPFGGSPSFPGIHNLNKSAIAPDRVFDELAQLIPPKKHYQHYYTTRSANQDMLDCPQGIAAFLRAYFHYKSADWSGNRPFALKAWEAHELAKMPTYYIMHLEQNMAETVAEFMPTLEQIENCQWLTEDELKFYAAEFSRTGFQGGLQWYRCSYDVQQMAELRLYSGKCIDVPACFIAGKQDWGTYQKPGVFEAMQNSTCSQFIQCHLIENAGHWVQQEQPDSVVKAITRFITESTSQ